MYTKTKGSSVPSDAQAREKLALYVYEYLLHVGAQKAAQTFLSEIRWEKNITLGEPPGFLHSWWCVFWDLYCAAPERRDSCEHSSEAKAFHDYGFVNSGYGVNGIAHNAGPAPSPIGQMPPNDGMPGGPMPPAFFPFMGPRYPAGPRPGVRMPQMGNDFNGPPGQPMMPNSMDPTRQGIVMPFLLFYSFLPSIFFYLFTNFADSDFFLSQDFPMSGGPEGGPMGPMGPNTMGPVLNGDGLDGMKNSPANGGPGTPREDSGSGMGDYNLGGFGGPGENKNIVCRSSNKLNSFKDVLHKRNATAYSVGRKTNWRKREFSNFVERNAVQNGQGIPPRTVGLPDLLRVTGLVLVGSQDQTESAAILKIKESMQEEAKRFEKDSDHPDYFIQ
ncbi:hypothetical protein M0802_009164 [Mischocyttarus mexicanus]|nr:hypothetical protein M0802_009164 [Mischocyttarus mexicanus]